MPTSTFRFPTKLSALEVFRFLEWSGTLAASVDIELDLTDVEFIDVTGIVPLVCIGEAAAQAGDHKVSWMLPAQDSPALRELQMAGWLAAIETGQSGPSLDRNFTDIIRFEDGSALNDAIQRVINQLSIVAEFPEGTLTAFRWVIGELTDNVLVHSGSPGWIQLGYRPNRRQVHLCVADSGIGIRRSLQRAYDIATDSEAIELAVQQGVTSGAGQGNGLAGSLRLAAGLRGFVNIVSGSGLLRQMDDGRQYLALAAGEPFRGDLHGTLLTLTLQADLAIDVSESLWGYSPVGAFEVSHHDGVGVVFVLADEASVFANRATGEELAIRLRNIAAAEPDGPIVIDFSEVSVATASFLDEFLGKILMKNESLARRIQVMNMDRLVERTYIHIKAQRTA